ncbi:MAG: hypothetical protein KF862_09575 [Chitinophagaceae bacterium]|nr:hypothetical protein [Chitinophagaceae bacterium]
MSFFDVDMPGRAGIVVDMAINDNISIQPGLHFVQKGVKEEEGGESLALSLNYGEVPVNFIYNFGETSSSFLLEQGLLLVWAFPVS